MKKFFSGVLLALVILFCGGCGRDASVMKQYADTAMGTVIQQNLYAANEEAANSISEEIMTVLEYLEKKILSRREETAEVFRINESAGAEEGFVLSEKSAEILRKCTELSERSDNAFDVSIGSLVKLWDIDSWAAGKESGIYNIPDAQEITKALSVCGSEKISIEEENGQFLIRIPAGMQLDLGAVGKGIALNDIREVLSNQQKVTGAVVSVGGSILLYGKKPDGNCWKVGIVDPFDTSRNIGILTVTEEVFISTSGDYERFVEVDGERYHHILDTATGYPTKNDVKGVTVLAKDGLVSDALSTACFVLGPKNGMRLCEDYGAEVLFVLSDGEIVMSEGMEQYFTAY